MAHTSIRGHFKLKRLAKLLEIPEVHAVGHLDYLWFDAYGRKEVGRDGILHGRTVDRIAAVAEWEGKAADFVTALVDSGFLDRAGDEYAIHDYFEWAPRFVQLRITRQEGAGHGRSKADTVGHVRSCAHIDDVVRPHNITEQDITKQESPAAADPTIGDKPDPAPLPTPSAAAVENEELKKELNRQGIDAPTDAMIANEFSGATVAAVRKALANVSPSASAGVRVTVLRDKLGKPEPVEKPNTFHDVPPVDPDLVRIRAWLETLEEELAEEYSVDKDEIDAAFKPFDTPAREHLRKLVTWAVARRLDAVPGYGGLPRKVGHTDLQKTILLWGFSSTDRARDAFMALAYPIIASNKQLSAIVAAAKAEQDARSGDTEVAPSDASEKPVVLDGSKSEAGQRTENAV